MNSVNLKDALKKLITSVNTASRKPIFEKYDKNVQGNTAHERGTVAASILTPFKDFEELPKDKSEIGVTIATGGRPELAKIDAKLAAEYAVCEALLKISCVGAEPLGVTDCLNFGNPEKKEQMGELVAGTEGVKKACENLEVPIVSGNVSLYNESGGKSIPPSALISVFGRVDDVHKIPKISFPICGKNCEPNIWFIGNFSESLAGSEFFRIYEKIATDVPEVDFKEFQKLNKFVKNLAQEGKVPTIVPIGVGGLWKTLCEGAFASNKGFEINLSGKNFMNELFGEPLGVMVVAPPNLDISENFEKAQHIGKLKNDFSFTLKSDEKIVAEGDLENYKKLWEDKLREIF